MTKRTSPNLLQAEADFVASGLELQAQALTLLLAEMHALSDVLPGAAAPGAAHPATDAEIEAEFDNMPV